MPDMLDAILSLIVGSRTNVRDGQYESVDHFQVHLPLNV